jgi:hypothetical protein
LSLTPGTHLGPYEIAAPIGVGGMGAAPTSLPVTIVLNWQAGLKH